MIELNENIFYKEIVLPNSPLKALNFYIIKGDERSLIIDTGFNLPETIEEMHKTFQELDLSYENTDLFLTHLHSDHTGLAEYFFQQGMDVYISKTDGDLLNESVKKEEAVWIKTVEHGHMQGLGVDGLKIEDHPGYKYRPLGYIDYKEAVPGEHIVIGKYDFEIIDLRGHSPGILGLYDAEHKILFCGDHILAKITPNITFWGFEYGDMLGTYFKSLNKVYNMEVDHLYSSHRHLVKDHRKRIDELRVHHAHRLEETREALRQTGKSTVRTVTKQLHWDIKSKSWEDFPDAQKWFAAGEAHAHLEHLRALGEVTMEKDDAGVLYYSLR